MIQPSTFAILDKASTADSTETKKIAEAMAGLSKKDREQAMAQTTCPVAGSPLGSMGTPVKVDVDGRAVFVCCEGCRSSLLEDPEKYLAKLPQEVAK